MIKINENKKHKVDAFINMYIYNSIQLLFPITLVNWNCNCYVQNYLVWTIEITMDLCKKKVMSLAFVQKPLSNF